MRERFMKMREIIWTGKWNAGKLMITACACLCFVAAALGQAPPGPLTPPAQSQTAATDAPPPPKAVQVKPRKNIFGDWKLNKDDSDDPHQKARQSHDNGSNGSNGG